MQFHLTAWVANLHRGQLLAEAETSRQCARLRSSGTRCRQHPLVSTAWVLALAGLWVRTSNERTICSEPNVPRPGC